ncbi:DNA-binding transcriptional regulator, XRE family [Singulisphaera sp. GP187]|uniref:helix-turn-helix domain-containing protein n=1 Tax=Singulisphaera sp. GP187 TaxID=1882752 RepID=UPI00092BA53D|nr:DNA-binding transcriptional regulator, XRE family [Singulisphaera sp. GP187]
MFRSKLKALKVSKGVSWAEISQKTGISPGTLSRLSADKSWTTNTRHLEALCRYFRCKLDDLLEFHPRIGNEPSVHIDDLYPSGRRRTTRPVAAQVGGTNERTPRSTAPTRRRRRPSS